MPNMAEALKHFLLYSCFHQSISMSLTLSIASEEKKS